MLEGYELVVEQLETQQGKKAMLIHSSDLIIQSNAAKTGDWMNNCECLATRPWSGKEQSPYINELEINKIPPDCNEQGGRLCILSFSERLEIETPDI